MIEIIPLYKVKYLARDEDPEFIAQKLVESPMNWGIVHYLAAPSGYGKISSILPAFLKSTEMENECSHYLHLHLLTMILTIINIQE